VLPWGYHQGAPGPGCGQGPHCSCPGLRAPGGRGEGSLGRFSAQAQQRGAQQRGAQGPNGFGGAGARRKSAAHHRQRVQAAASLKVRCNPMSQASWHPCRRLLSEVPRAFHFTIPLNLWVLFPTPGS